MSTKQFISAEEHLAKLGVTVQQAQDFITANVGQAEVIFQEVVNGGVTNPMLSEITNFSESVIDEYFTSNNMDSSIFNRTSELFNSYHVGLESFVNFNNKNGNLSNASLREKVQPLLDSGLEVDYDSYFGPIFLFQTNDGVYDPEELGVSHLGNVPATDETIESLFYGTLLNMFAKLDRDEFNQIDQFPEGGNSELLKGILLQALSDTPTPTIAWTELELADLVPNEAARIINGYDDSGFVGILDFSYLGLAIA